MPYGRVSAVPRHFTVVSYASQVVSTSAQTPSGLPDIVLHDGSAQFTVDSANNAVRNNGAYVGELVGTLSIQPTAGAGSARTLSLWSEVSADGVTWTPIPNSLRTVDVRAGLESFVSLSSRGDEFPAGAWVRWQMYADDTVSIAPPTEVVLGSGTAVGYSVLWELTEVV